MRRLSYPVLAAQRGAPTMRPCGSPTSPSQGSIPTNLSRLFGPTNLRAPSEGCADHDFIYELAAHLLPVGMTIDPRKVAELASIAVAFEMPEEE